MGAVMTALAAAAKDQEAASDPNASAWASASAGSGKTKVLTDRVLSLLLNGTPPEKILCLTFTKAAAAEMANRVNTRLGNWLAAQDDVLRVEISTLIHQPADDRHLHRARRLLAMVLDAPGGLKIQTIHSFCQSLLGRFPIEAGIAPNFEVLDDRTAAEMMAAAQNTVLLSTQEDEKLRDALQTVTSHIDETAFVDLMKAIAAQRSDIQRFFQKHGGVEGAIAATYDLLAVEPGETDPDIVAQACAAGAFDELGLTRAAAALQSSDKKTDLDRGAGLRAWLRDDISGRVLTYDDYVQQFLTQKLEIRSRLATKAVTDNDVTIETLLRQEADRLFAVAESRRACVTANATSGLLRMASAVLDAYQKEKDRRARVDYEDLILHTRRLLRENIGAAWVLFKLDGGLDHILIDEAQDTNPEQWEIIAALAEEFFAGAGAQGAMRTVFAVGDIKQSIYSFQRADPRAFTAMRTFFSEKAKAAQLEWRNIELVWSFRSARAVLQGVDAVFTEPAARDGVADGASAILHRAVRQGQAGLVELWPVVEPHDATPPQPWAPPIGRQEIDSPANRLAQIISHKVASWIGTEVLPSKGRPIRAGDIMILVRQRNRLVDAIVRALKNANVPVAGVDRMVLTEQLAVMDLIALGQFLLLPEDDLTLATVLKGPLVGLEEETLFRLAYNRGGETLWSRLGTLAQDDPDVSDARSWLSHLLSRVDFDSPYELYAGVLFETSLENETGRQRIVGRLGLEAEDPLEEFMSLALSYDRMEAPSLQNFLHWVEAGDVEVKRDLEQGGDNVRVITVHGAKGLQAPIVIMPDTTTVPIQSPRLLWHNGILLWPPVRDNEEKFCRQARAAANQLKSEEYRRLLYVAMTRAEDRLYVCGWRGRAEGNNGKEKKNAAWYDLVADGLRGIAEPVEFEMTNRYGLDFVGSGLRYETAQTAPAETAAAVATLPPKVDVEPWMTTPPPAEPSPPRPLAPSRPSGENPPVNSPLIYGDQSRFQRGLLIHRLLQTLPELRSTERRPACRRFLQRQDIAENLRQAVEAEVIRIIDDIEFASIFGPESRAEVPIVGTVPGRTGPEIVSGQVDRLVVLDDVVQVIDFKTNRPPPDNHDDVPAVYLHQMAAYRAVLMQIWPGRRIDCYLLWTDKPAIMCLDHHSLDRLLTPPLD